MSDDSTSFEVCYTMSDYYDGPRRGITDFHGKPHLYESLFTDIDDAEDTFLLMPVAADILGLPQEDWAIWLRWQAAYEDCKATIDTHPALPEDQKRHRELDEHLKEKLVMDPTRAVRAKAEFRYMSDPGPSGLGLVVRWTLVASE
jgi:hypothetical protein